MANCTKADPAYGKGVADALAKFAAGQPEVKGLASCRCRNITLELRSVASLDQRRR